MIKSRWCSPYNECLAFDLAGNLLDSGGLEQQARKDKADPKVSRDSQPLNTRWDVTSDEVEFDYAHLPKVMGNLLQQYTGTHYQHDVRGNRTRETAPSGHTTEYTYDAEDRLIAAKRYRRAPAAGDNALPEMQAKYGYDGFGRRLYKLVKQAKRPAQLTVFTWGGDLLTSEETFEGEYSFLERWAYPVPPELEREVPEEQYSLPIAQRVHSIITQPQQRTHWLYEPESFIPAAQQVETYQDTQQLRTGTDAASLTTAGATTSEPRLYLIHTDHLGTPQELTDSEGALHWSGQYRAWGELQKATDWQSNAASIEMRLRFQGQYHDEETGLHYNRFRYYDPRVGRFTTQDPISLAGGINLYQYASNPVGWVDPYGLTNSPNLRRPYIRKGTRQAIEENAKVKNGRFLDSNTGLPIPGEKRRSYSLAEGKYDLGHKPGHEHWREASKAKQQGLTQRQFNDRMNNPNMHHIEDPKENQSHRHECKKK